ncbi:fatty acid--CoA ligase family protein [Magnetospira sp. QH-2]|uniref:ANL family adenylate-forming protein n=1 Tax=Magnetospira sp. (strain QH-2) TaxID=1288970 RepID=UPI0003E81830|nr:fatty acid--CoA ligase family protein [Magnetospira sp. QH-2]CCQ75514.1 putative AMP-dependent synthetase and ligase [Magnetospira sp. QH-2]
MDLTAITTVLERMRGKGSDSAVISHGTTTSYDELCSNIEVWKRRLGDYRIGQGSIVAVYGDYDRETIAVFFALMELRAIAVPLTPTIKPEIPGFLEIAQAQFMIVVEPSGEWSCESLSADSTPPLIERFLPQQHPGLIVFTSGSTGKPKGILHDGERVMQKFVTERPGWRTILFLLMDHFGGMNTLYGTFAYGGVALCPDQRSPDTVCALIEKGQATLLPTTPTFLNLIIASGAWRKYDLTSLRLITYGTELMNESTLSKVREIFPNVTVKQTYGLSEIGVVRSKSDTSDSVWVKIGGQGFDTRIVDGLLWIKSEANMVGYLNADSPFDEDGWLCTGDRVEQKGEHVRFLGRETEAINVGGQKLFPAEVEEVLLSDENVAEAAVYGIPHPVLGKAVAARVTLLEIEDEKPLLRRLKMTCKERLQKYKVPMKIKVVEPSDQYSERFKKLRKVEQ